MVDELYSDLKEDYDDNTAEMMRKEMVRGIILYTGITPDKINLACINPKLLPEKKWLEYLNFSNFSE